MTCEFEIFDDVLIKDGKYAGKTGMVESIAEKTVKVRVHLGDVDIFRFFKPTSLELIPPLEIDAEIIRKLVRFELTAREARGDYPILEFEPTGEYQMTLDDLEVALENLIARGYPTAGAIADDCAAADDCVAAGDYFDADVDADADDDTYAGAHVEEDDYLWFWLTFEELYVHAGIFNCIEGEPEEGDIAGMPSRYSVFAEVRDALIDRYEYGDECATGLPELLDYIRAYRLEREKPAIERELSLNEKRVFVQVWPNKRVATMSNAEIETLYVKYVTDLVEAGDELGLREMAYACYGIGHAGFAEDWVASRDCLLKLEEIAPKAMYANTLGYIYYYGRCNGGEPEYEKAFYWFSVGAAGGFYESRYKLADMLKDGKGCVKDTEIAAHLLWDLYNENLGHFCKGESGSKFADIALRVGNLCRDGVGRPVSRRDAFDFYLMAKLAIRMRRQRFDAYGDAVVEQNIDNAIAGLRKGLQGESLPAYSGVFVNPAQEVTHFTPHWFLRFAMGYGRRIRVDYKWFKGRRGGTFASQLKLTFQIQDKPGTKYGSKFPVLLSEAHFCGMVEKLVVMCEAPEPNPDGDEGVAFWNQGIALEGFGEALPGESGSIVFDEVNEDGELLLYGERVAVVRTRATVDARKLKGENRRYVSVTFGDPDRTWEYLCDDEQIQSGVRVRVPWGECEREGVVRRTCERYDSEVELPRKAYKRVIEALCEE